MIPYYPPRIKPERFMFDSAENLVGTFTRDIHRGDHPFVDGVIALADGSKPALGARVDNRIYRFVAERFGWQQ